MPKISRFNYREITKLLKSKGFYLYRRGRGSHEQWARDCDKKIVTVPNHGKKELSLGVIKNILKAVKNFKGIKHRLEFVKKINGISFYNDSAATNPDATLAALKSFKESIHLILGGSDKGLDYKNLAGYISKSKNIKTIALIGQIKEKLLEPFGQIYIEVPSFYRVEVRAKKVFVPVHISYFTETSLNNLLLNNHICLKKF